MAEGTPLFDYVAIDPSGRRVKGALSAGTDSAAFAQLKGQGLSPLRIRPARSSGSRRSRGHGLSDREAAEFLADLAALLQAGSSLRTALGIIGAKADRPTVRAACKEFVQDIGGGGALDQAFGRVLGPRHAFAPALVMSAEAAGDLAGGFQRGAEMLAWRVRLRDQLVSVLAYPMFVLATSIVAVCVILLLVIPALAPLVDQPGSKPPLQMQVLIAVSTFVRHDAPLLAVAAGAAIVGTMAAARLGLVAPWLDRLGLDGPFRRITRALVYGGFAVELGNMLASGAAMSQALRLGVNAIRSPSARGRIEPALSGVRQGQSLSEALERVPGFPLSVIRLAAIGEATGGLGPSIARAGKLEQEAALRRIETAGRLIGPVLIVILGVLIGLLMGGLLTGVSQLGNTALQ